MRATNKHRSSAESPRAIAAGRLHRFFRWNGALILVTTHFFRASLRDPAQTARAVHDASYHEGVVWIARAKVPEALGFDDHILRAVSALL